VGHYFFSLQQMSKTADATAARSQAAAAAVSFSVDSDEQRFAPRVEIVNDSLIRKLAEDYLDARLETTQARSTITELRTRIAALEAAAAPDVSRDESSDNYIRVILDLAEDVERQKAVARAATSTYAKLLKQSSDECDKLRAQLAHEKSAHEAKMQQVRDKYVESMTTRREDSKAQQQINAMNKRIVELEADLRRYREAPGTTIATATTGSLTSASTGSTTSAAAVAAASVLPPH
jgi:chromosome segregation ATPase